MVRSSIVACLLLGVLFVGNPMVSNGTKAAPASIGEVATVASTQADSVAALLLLQQRLDRIFTSPGYRPVGVSAKVVSLRTGRTLYERNADLPLTPASTTKLFTTASLYWLSGADARLHTEARTTGTLDANGTLRGDLYLVGCGDAMLTVQDVEDLADRIIAAGVRKITGAVYGDGSRFDAQTSRALYSGDNEEVEATGSISALNINRGTIAFLVSASRTGIATVQPIPASDAITVVSRVAVIAPRKRGVRTPSRGVGTPSRSGVRRNPRTKTRQSQRRELRRRGDAPPPVRYRRHAVARLQAHPAQGKDGRFTYIVSGTISTGSSATVYAQVPRPSMMVAGVLSQRLRSGGVEVGSSVGEKACPASSTLLAQTGRPLLEFASVINKRSDNHFAEHAFKMCGMRSGAIPSSAASSRAVILRAMDSLNVPRIGMQLNDGSGLSRRNVVSATTQVGLLRACSIQPWAEEFRNTLAIAGVDGSIRRRMIGTPAMQNVRAKTGTLRNVSSLSGYVTTRDGEPMAFAFISNGNAVSSYKAAEDAAAISLASFSWTPSRPLVMPSVPTRVDSMKDKVNSERP